MQYVGAVIGAVIGFYAGGVTGAIYGAEIGYTLGAVIAASNEKIVSEGPRLSDLRTTISSNGVFIPRIYVKVGNVGGNIIDATSLKETTTQVEAQSSGGKGGPTQVTNVRTYSASFMVLLCKSLGDRHVVEIKANGNLIWSRSSTASGATLVASQGLVGQIIVYDGAPDQMPDPTLEAIHGVGNVPGYRGRLCVMFVDFQLEKYSNNIEATQLTFTIAEGDDAPTTRTLNALVNGGQFATNPGSLYDANGVYWTFGAAPETGYGTAYVAYRDALDGDGLQRQRAFRTWNYPLLSISMEDNYTLIKKQTTFFDGVGQGEVAAVFLLVPSTHFVYQDGPPVTRSIVNDGFGSIYFYTPTGGRIGDMSIVPFTAFAAANPDPSGTMTTVRQVAYAGKKSLLAYARTFGTVQTPAAILVFHSQVDVETFPTFTRQFVGASVVGMRAANDRLYVVVAEKVAMGHYQFALYLLDLATGQQVDRWNGPMIASDAGGAPPLKPFVIGADVYVTGGYSWRWDDTGAFHDFVSGSGGLANFQVLDTNGHDYTLSSYDVPTGSTTVANEMQHVLAVSASIVEPNYTRPWSQVIAEIGAEKGFTAFDFSGLPDTVVCRGYVITRQTSPRVAIDFARDLIRVDCADSRNKVKLVRRGADAVATLVTDELGAMEGDGDRPQAIEWTVADELTQPAVVILKFSDVDNNFEVATAIARRETTASQVVVTLDCTAVMMTGTEAARYAEQALTDQRLAAETVKFSTTYTHELLETSDPIIVPGSFKNRRVRIDSKTDKGGLVEWSGVRDDPSALTQFVIGGGAANKNPGGQQIVVAPLVTAEVLNLPSLRLNDDDSGCYLFVSSGAPGRMRGATAYDNVGTVPRVVGTVQSPGGVKGYTDTVLPAFSGVGFDWGSSVDVEFPKSAVLESVTQDRLYAGNNVFLVGGEIIGALTVTSLGNGVWRMTGLLRGLRGTQRAMNAHAIGDPVYWLTIGGLLRDRVVAGDLVVGAVGTDRPMSDVNDYSETATNTAQSLVAFAPVQLAYGPTSSGKTFKWKRQSRKIPADPFNVPPDDGTDVYQFQICGSFAFDASTTSAAVTGETYATTTAAPFYARVAQIGGDGQPGAFSDPVHVT